MKKLSFYFLLILFFAACNSTKHVAENEHMLTRNYIFIDNVKDNSSALEKYILQKPNPRLLGAPIGLYFHNLGDHEKPKTALKWGEKHPKKYKIVKNIFSEKQSIAYANSFIKLNNWFLSYDAPVIISDHKIKRTSDNLWAYYKTQGYFESEVSATIIRDSIHKKATAEYRINRGRPTLLDTIKLKTESLVLDSIYKDAGMRSLLISGDQYNDKVFRKEASNVVKLFRNSGIYHFSEAALGFYVDSTRTDYKTNVEFLIAKDRFKDDKGVYVKKDYKVHRIKEINVFTDYSYTKKEEIHKDTVTYNGINFLAHRKLKYNPKYLAQSIFFSAGDVYKDTLRDLTRNHLKSLNNFKSTSIKFTPISGLDNALKMDLFLAPKEKFTLGFETELTHSNIRNIGSSAKFSLTNRNAFRGAELLKFSFLGSYFNAKNGPGWEIGADASLEFPRLIAPFGLSKLVPKRMSPRTLFSLGSSFQKNIGLDRQTFTFVSDYKWQYNIKKTIQLELFNTQYIQNLNVNRFFDIYSSEFTNLNTVAEVYDIANGTSYFPLATDLKTQASESLRFIKAVASNNGFKISNSSDYNTVLNIQNRYNIVTSDFLIPTLAYSYTYNSQIDFKDNNFSFFKARFSNSGNLLGLLSNNYNVNGKKTLFKIPLAQYFKTDLEYKRFWSIGSNSVFGFRTFLGAILTYDNSDIPFTRSYFAGGSNDIRAWQTYELGPGSRNSGLEFNVGSFKFLTSAEYRFDLVSSLKGALFLDAGNIWDISGSEFVDEDSKFNDLSSLKDIAIGSGFGIRYDLNFFVLRFDIGFKTYEPYLEESKWFKNYNFASAVYNIGINYPF
ncbi:BamA/TamA family outer membrane protein [Polaribacter sp. IC073]|uniref:translocation and assembly module lipoprotein TamL n=1 Tax=Polaribacter sp. IC073 TaxID=2508540 RepID=UPI0011BF0227|nr:BamA/TamA family outer membrane protein [Polaribacter sp. IC073]TXD46849.1 BamA/TamA family outer membrane protein [Polaribacter sp. IC073]